MATRAATQGKPKRTPKRNGTPGTPGRPHDLDRPIPQPGGAPPIPASEAVLRQMRTGLPLAESAQSVGLSRATAYHWRGEGAAVTQALADGQLQEDKLTAYQQACRTFFDGAMQAEAHAVALNAARLQQLASGGYTTTREVTDYDASGNVLGKRVTTATVPPDTKAVTFFLERRAVNLFGKAIRVEHAAGAEGPLVQTESPLAKLAEALEGIERRREQGRAQLAIIEVEEAEQEAS